MKFAYRAVGELDDDSILIPYGEFVAEWIALIAPKGLEFIESGGFVDDLTTQRSGPQISVHRG